MDIQTFDDLTPTCSSSTSTKHKPTTPPTWKTQVRKVPMRGMDVPRKCARATSLGDKEYRALRDDADETSKTIGQTDLTTTRKRKATWEAQRYVKLHQKGKISEDKLSQTESTSYETTCSCTKLVHHRYINMEFSRVLVFGVGYWFSVCEHPRIRQKPK